MAAGEPERTLFFLLRTLLPVLTAAALAACSGSDSPLQLPEADLEGAGAAVVELIEQRRQTVAASPSAESWGRLGMAYQAHEFNGAAAECYGQAARMAQDQYRWPYLQGMALTNSDPEQAAVLFERAVQLDPSNPAVYVRYGDLLLNLGRSLEARRQYERALAQDADSTHALYGLAQTDLLSGDPQAARKRLERARQIAPFHGEVRQLLSQTYRRLGMDAEAESESQAALTFSEGSAPPDPVYAQVLDQSASSQALTRRGLERARKGQFAEAEEFFRRVLADGKGNARDYANLGAALAGQNRLDEAMMAYRRALEIDPLESFAHYNMGLALSQSGQHEAAAKHLETALDIDPTYADAYNALGLSHLQRGDKAQAINSFSEAVRLNPGLLPARSNLAKSLADSGQVARAIEEWQAVLEVDPNHLETLYNLAIAQSMVRRYAESVRYFQRGIELAPNSSLFARGLAWQLATAPAPDLRDGQRAVQLARPVVQRFPQDPQALDLLAAALAESGDFDRAAGLAQRALLSARSQGQHGLAAQIATRLGLYQEKKPFRQPPGRY